MERTTEDVGQFLSTCGHPEAMAKLDAIVVGHLPGASRTLWRGDFWGGTAQAIVAYGDILQQRPRGGAVPWYLVGLAEQQRYFSLYVHAVEDGRYLGQAYADRLGKVKVGAAAITFRSLEDLDLDGLHELLARAATQLPSPRSGGVDARPEAGDAFREAE